MAPATDALLTHVLWSEAKLCHAVGSFGEPNFIEVVVGTRGNGSARKLATYTS